MSAESNANIENKTVSPIEVLSQITDETEELSTELPVTPSMEVTDILIADEGQHDSDEKYSTFERLRPFPHPIYQPHLAAYWLLEFGFGLVSLFGMLALLAAIPVVNFLALGYLLEAEGRVARTGKLRYAMPLLALAPKLGGIAIGTWFWLIMVRMMASVARDATLMAPGTTTDVAWQFGLIAFSAFVAIHLVLAIARGGRLGLFFWPTPLNGMWLWRQVERGNYFETASLAICDFVTALRLRHHFWLGLRGFGLALVWLFLPTALFSTLRDTSKPGQVIITLIGGAALMVVLSWIPFLQARFAAENRWRAMFELKAIRELYRKAPLVMLFSAFVLYAFSLPLYLLKVVALPEDVYWLLTPIFILTIYPAKILVGWAYSLAMRQDSRAWFLLRGTCSLVMMPLLAVYVFVLFFTPAIGAAGRAVLFQHHGILLPWPF